MWECVAGGEGTVVDRTTYGQCERCSFNRSNCLCGRGGELLAPFCCGGAKAHNPTRRWQSVQYSNEVSRLRARSDGVGLARETRPRRNGRDRGVEAGGVPRSPASKDITEDERDTTGVGRADDNTEPARERDVGITELARETEVARSGAGGARLHPKRDVNMAVSEGST
jgi:hypothetical protein